MWPKFTSIFKKLARVPNSQKRGQTLVLFFKSVAPVKCHTRKANGSHSFEKRAKVWSLFWEFGTDRRVKICLKFSQKWPNFGPLFKNVAPVKLPLVTFNGSHTFEKQNQSLAIFLRIWNSGQLFENRCKIWPQIWSLLYFIKSVELQKLIIFMDFYVEE